MSYWYIRGTAPSLTKGLKFESSQMGLAVGDPRFSLKSNVGHWIPDGKRKKK